MSRTDTWFASPQRSSVDEINAAVKSVAGDPFVTQLLQLVDGFLIVLNENRQIVAVNSGLAQFLDVDCLEPVVGMRPGEVLGCIHAEEGPGGCGTGPMCASCGAVIAIVATLDAGEPSEETCAVTLGRGDQRQEYCFRVRAARVNVEGKPYVLVFLKDDSVEQYRAALEQIFFHDVNNLIQGLVGYAHLLANRQDNPRARERVSYFADRLMDEIRIQSALSNATRGHFQPTLKEIRVPGLLNRLSESFAQHPRARGKSIILPPTIPQSCFIIRSDISIVLRILNNMVLNAMEATDLDGVVKLSVEEGKNRGVRISVWNQASIPEEVKGRIFQRYFSTKGGKGRGLGTYSMKLLGQDILGGKVGFTSSPSDGTTFWLEIPRGADPEVEA